MNNEAMVFDGPTEVPITIKEIEYILTEASEATVSSHLSSQSKAAKPDKDGKPNLEKADMAALQMLESALLCKCLTNGDGKQVEQDLIRSWPDRVVKSLVVRLKDISGMGDSKESLIKQRDMLNEAIDNQDTEDPKND